MNTLIDKGINPDLLQNLQKRRREQNIEQVREDSQWDEEQKKLNEIWNRIKEINKAGIYRKVCDGKVIMAADIKYARAVRGMSHEDAPECEFYNRTKKIRCFNPE